MCVCDECAVVMNVCVRWLCMCHVTSTRCFFFAMCDECVRVIDVCLCTCAERACVKVVCVCDGCVYVMSEMIVCGYDGCVCVANAGVMDVYACAGVMNVRSLLLWRINM